MKLVSGSGFTSSGWSYHVSSRRMSARGGARQLAQQRHGQCPSRAPCGCACARARSASLLSPAGCSSRCGASWEKAMRQGNGQRGPAGPRQRHGRRRDRRGAQARGRDIVFGYPRNQILEAAARIDIRTVIVRQERTGLHMADAMQPDEQGRRDGRVRDAARPRAPRTPWAASRRPSPRACRCW